MFIFVLLSAFGCDVGLISDFGATFDSCSVLHFPNCKMAFFFLHQGSLDHNYEIKHRYGITCYDGRPMLMGFS